MRRTRVTRPDRGGRRALRIGVLGGSSLLLACAAHTAGGGTLPPWWLLAVLGGFVGTIAVALTARRIRLRTLLPVLVLEQAGLHLALSLGAAAGCPTTGMTGITGVSASTGMTGMSGMGAMTGMGGCAATSPDMVHGWTSMAPMLLGHLVATLLTAWLLARGEALLWRAADTIIARATARPGRRRARRARPVLPVVGAEVVSRGWITAGPRAPPRPLLTAG